MIKRTVLILLFVLNLIWISGCSAEKEPAAETAATESAVTEPIVTEPAVTEPPIPAIHHFDLGPDDQYTISGGDTLYSYYDEPLESFLGVCKDYEAQGWSLYNARSINGNHFATYTNANELAHIYWIACERELNVVNSVTGGEALPPANPIVKSGNTETTVTQLQSSKVNGMGYIIQLADGSFLVIDGGYTSGAKELWSALVALNGGKENIVIRAWLLTHSHNDHYGCFSSFAARYASKVTLETLMISPVSEEDAAGSSYLSTKVNDDIARFDGAKLLYVHTGMAFHYCNVTWEILYTPDDFMIAEPTQDKNYAQNLDFNSTSVISRIRTRDYRAIFLADSTEKTALRLSLYYGDYLRSEMCQASHHGVEDFPLIVYRIINASTYWYPSSLALYESEGRYSDVRKAIAASESTKEILLHDQLRITRPLSAKDDRTP